MSHASSPLSDYYIVSDYYTNKQGSDLSRIQDTGPSKNDDVCYM